MNYYQSNDSLDYRRMPREEEQQLFRMMKLGGVAGDKAREVIIRNFLPACLALVRRIVRHTSNEDLVAVANAGLLQAVDRFDPSRGTCFLTYASFFIRGRILRELRARYRQVEIAERVAAKSEESLLRFGMRKIRGSQRGPGGDEEPEGPNSKIQVPLVDATPAGIDLDFDQKEKIHGILGDDCGPLNKQQRTVITFAYLESMNYAEISKVMKISRERVRIVHNQAIAKLKRVL